MALKNLTLRFPEETLKLTNGESFAVRGLSLSDITVLVSVHREKLTELYNEFAVPAVNGGFELPEESGAVFGISLVQMAPTLVAHIIAQAEVRDPDDDPAFDVALRLPVDVQLEALEKIIRLTFQTEGGPKKVLETIIRAFTGTMQFAAGLKT